jgi:hypothetical protein
MRNQKARRMIQYEENCSVACKAWRLLRDIRSVDLRSGKQV